MGICPSGKPGGWDNANQPLYMIIHTVTHPVQGHTSRSTLVMMMRKTQWHRYVVDLFEEIRHTLPPLFSFDARTPRQKPKEGAKKRRTRKQNANMQAPPLQAALHPSPSIAPWRAGHIQHTLPPKLPSHHEGYSIIASQPRSHHSRLPPPPLPRPAPRHPTGPPA